MLSFLLIFWVSIPKISPRLLHYLYAGIPVLSHFRPPLPSAVPLPSLAGPCILPVSALVYMKYIYNKIQNLGSVYEREHVVSDSLRLACFT